MHIMQPLLTGQVDWDRMRRVLKRDYNARREGKTFATVAMMIREVLTSTHKEANYVYIGHNKQMSRFVCDDIVEIFDAIGVTWLILQQGHQVSFRLGNTQHRVLFMPADTTDISHLLGFKGPRFLFNDWDYVHDPNYEVIAYLGAGVGTKVIV